MQTASPPPGADESSLTAIYLDTLLDSQDRQANAEEDFIRAAADYQIAQPLGLGVTQAHARQLDDVARSEIAQAVQRIAVDVSWGDALALLITSACRSINAAMPT